MPPFPINRWPPKCLLGLRSRSIILRHMIQPCPLLFCCSIPVITMSTPFLLFNPYSFHDPTNPDHVPSQRGSGESMIKPPPSRGSGASSQQSATPSGKSAPSPYQVGGSGAPRKNKNPAIAGAELRATPRPAGVISAVGKNKSPATYTPESRPMPRPQQVGGSGAGGRNMKAASPAGAQGRTKKKPVAIPVPAAHGVTQSLQRQEADAAREAQVASIEETEIETGIPMEIVVAFVEELEKAHQYSKLKKYLRERCPLMRRGIDSADVSYELTKIHKGQLEYNLLEEPDFRHAVEAYVQDDGKYNLLDMDVFELQDPIYYLEFRAREEGYGLSETPEAELEKMKKFAPLFYHDTLLSRKPAVKAEARTVTVRNISCDVSEKQIIDFFRAFGTIKNVETDSTLEGQIAHITYKELAEAKCAQSFSGKKISYISQRIKPPVYADTRRIQAGMNPHYCTSTVSYFEQFAPLLIQAKCAEDDSDAESAVKTDEDVSDAYGRALDKYRSLRAHFSKCVKAAKDEGGRGSGSWMCWMGLEALANGGYTVGGRSLRRREA